MTRNILAFNLLYSKLKNNFLNNTNRTIITINKIYKYMWRQRTQKKSESSDQILQTKKEILFLRENED